MSEVNHYYFNPVPTNALFAPPADRCYFSSPGEKIYFKNPSDQFGTLEVISKHRNRLGHPEDDYVWHTNYNTQTSLTPELGRELLNCFTTPAFLEKYSQTLFISSELSRVSQNEDTLTITDLEQLSEANHRWPKISKFCSSFWSGDKTIPLDILQGTVSYPSTENSFWPGLDKIFSQFSVDFFKSQILISTATAMAGFFIGERVLGALAGGRTIGTSCLWVLYSINFTGLILSTLKSQLNWKQKLNESYTSLDSNEIDISQRKKINRSIAETKSEMAKSWLYWGITIPLVSAVCYFDKSFLSAGPLKFFLAMPTHFARGVPAALNSLFGLCMTVGSAYSIYTASNLWFETYLGLKEENPTNIAYSVFSTVTLGIALISRASWEMNRISALSGSFSMRNFSILGEYSFRSARAAMQSNIIGLPLLTLAGFCGITAFLYNSYADLTDNYSASDAHEDLRRERDRLKAWLNE